MFSLFALLLAFYITVVLVPLFKRWAGTWGMLDVPDSRRKLHAVPTPRVGGIAMAMGILLPAWLWVPFNTATKAYFLGAGVILVFGFFDDLLTLGYKTKFAGQAAAVLLAMGIGRFYVSNLGIWAGHEILVGPWIGIPLTFFFLLGTTNAVNLADGLDGLAGGLCIFVFSTLALLAYQQGENDITILCLVILGALLGFLRYNTFPATVFMGDTGSQMLGFSAGILSLYLTQAPHTALARTLPLLILGVPLLDTVSVMTERLIEGRSPFESDTRHFHYRLLQIGASHVASVVCIYLIQAMMATAAVVLRFYPEDWVFAVFLLFAGLILGPLWILIRWNVSLQSLLSWGEGWKRWMTATGIGGRIAAWSLSAMRAILSVGLIWLSLSIPHVGSRIWEHALFAATAFGMIVSYWVFRPVFLYLVRFSLYLVGFYVFYTTRNATLAFTPIPIRFFHYALWGTLAFLLIVHLLASREKYFEASTLDYLLLLIVILIPFLPMESIRDYRIGTMAGGMMVLLWSTEVLIRGQKKPWGAIVWTSVVCLALITVFGP